MERLEIIPQEKYSVVLEESRKKRPAEDESDALYFYGEMTEYSGQGTDQDTDLLDETKHKMRIIEKVFENNTPTGFITIWLHITIFKMSLFCLVMLTSPFEATQ
ncbi:hypothetical protein AVEN_21191-1 [Araneus ventricosus]|uniref:Uncharacterized protein n=1 Tax=Araneus ventricosus TaxID=182803 RepID=A0A4Y2MEH3_ARAVE|nr:hypothetical protein AVEN_21191-1 [Araneus ventricosus]